MKETELVKWIHYAFGKIELPIFSPDMIYKIIQVDQKILKRILLGGKFEEDEIEEDADREMISDDVNFGLGPIGNK